MEKVVTREFIETFLATKSEQAIMQFIGRALVVIFKNQTASEQRSNMTTVHNNIGFTGADAISGSLSAKSFMKNGKLADWQVKKWTKKSKNGVSRIAKYHRQLDIAAQAKLQEKEKCATIGN